MSEMGILVVLSCFLKFHQSGVIVPSAVQVNVLIILLNDAGKNQRSFQNNIPNYCSPDIAIC